MVQVMKPVPDLAQRIERCLFIPSTEGSGKAIYEFLPDSGMSLALRISPTTCRMVLLGPATKNYCAEVDEASSYFCLRFRPGQAPRLADAHPKELIDGFVELTRIRGERVDSLAERFQTLPDLPSRQRLMEDLVRGSGPLVRDERCRQATALMQAHGGAVKVNELADRFGLHIRSLERLFLDQLGISPKRLTRLMRLRHLLECLHGRRVGSLADLAYACGYADQSHLIKEFKELTGRLPGEPGSFRVRRLDGKAPTGAVMNRRGSDEPGIVSQTIVTKENPWKTKRL